jgi:hypothetical protein
MVSQSASYQDRWQSSNWLNRCCMDPDDWQVGKLLSLHAIVHFAVDVWCC